MPPRVSAIESHPEFYPDIIAVGGLAHALARTAAGLGLEIAIPQTVRDGASADVRLPAVLPARTDLTITARRYRRLFSVDNHECGIAHARGHTPDLAEVARAAAAWLAGADPRGMKAAAPFIELPLMAEARATGSAQAVVEANWQLRREAWSRRWEYQPDGWQEPMVLTALPTLSDAAYAQPRLRCLYAVTSHSNLWFSRCTDFPFARTGIVISPQRDGRYLMRSSAVDGEILDTPEAAAARAAQLLPSDCGPAILGTAADVRT